MIGFRGSGYRVWCSGVLGFRGLGVQRFCVQGFQGEALENERRVGSLLDQVRETHSTDPKLET